MATDRDLSTVLSLQTEPLLIKTFNAELLSEKRPSRHKWALISERPDKLGVKAIDGILGATRTRLRMRVCADGVKYRGSNAFCYGTTCFAGNSGKAMGEQSRVGSRKHKVTLATMELYAFLRVAYCVAASCDRPNGTHQLACRSSTSVADRVAGWRGERCCWFPGLGGAGEETFDLVGGCAAVGGLVAVRHNCFQ